MRRKVVVMVLATLLANCKSWVLDLARENHARYVNHFRDSTMFRFWKALERQRAWAWQSLEPKPYVLMAEVHNEVATHTCSVILT